MKMPLFWAVTLIASAPAFTQTSPPATPQLTAGAEFKGLRFDWEPVARATSYQLEYRAHQAGAFVPQGGALQASTTSTHFTFPLHLFDWTYARYRLAACNSAGCTRSAEVSVSLLRRDAVGYFKPAQPLINQQFGDDVALTPDGYNFVAAAPGDVIQSGSSSRAGGAIYVFRRGGDGAWFQRARLTPTIPPFLDESINYMSVGISASGNTVAVGMPNYLHEEFDENAGEVQVFHWNGTSWGRARVPRVAAYYFGEWVALSDSGYTLAAEFRGTGGAGTGIALYKLVAGVWHNVRIVPDSLDGFEHCDTATVLSRDGSTLAQHCIVPSSPTSAERHLIRTWSGNNWTVRNDIPLESSSPSSLGYANSGLGISANGDTIAANIYVTVPDSPEAGASQVNVFKRTNGVYSKVAELTPGPWADGTYRGYYGFDIAVSGDGATLAVGDPSDVGQGTGPRAAPLIAGTEKTGAVYIYRLTNAWKLANMVKPNYPNERLGFGRVLGLSHSGRTLIIGEPGDASSARGIGGDWRNTEDPASGAVWMY
jgi:hypothetical protein